VVSEERPVKQFALAFFMFAGPRLFAGPIPMVRHSLEYRNEPGSSGLAMIAIGVLFVWCGCSKSSVPVPRPMGHINAVLERNLQYSRNLRRFWSAGMQIPEATAVDPYWGAEQQHEAREAKWQCRRRAHGYPRDQPRARVILPQPRITGLTHHLADQ
jgi:hypothetical protein